MGIHQSIVARPRIRTSGLWTEELVAQAAKLWNSGMGAAKVAQTLGPRFTKNSVIGLTHRNPTLFVSKRAKAANANPNKLSSSKKLEASHMWKAGFNSGEIAKHFGIKQGAVENMVARDRHLFPRRDEYVPIKETPKPVNHPDRVTRTTITGAKITLPRVVFIDGPYQEAAG